MSIKPRFLVCVWVLVCGWCVGRFVEENNLEVTFPESLKGRYECVIGEFGVPRYGKTMISTVLYPKENQNGCRNFDVVNASFQSNFAGNFPTFLLVDRGECYFAIKAWRAQEGGAAAILIADDIKEPLISMYTREEAYGSPDADYLQEISIPSALISKSLGDSIKKVLSSGEMVNINLHFCIPSALINKEKLSEKHKGFRNENCRDGEAERNYCSDTIIQAMGFVRAMIKHAKKIQARASILTATCGVKTWKAESAL
ncbi:hypothetical protein VNO77_24700 [Canavalia gladiata]|uniref:PA domain-containing protein n=1 Tax=Canavalia gladiata TaxID=3824 RepID=A0AAN9L6T6_CANGL